MIERLRRNDERMRRWRWWLLVFGVICLGAVAFSFSTLLRLLRFFREPDVTTVLVIACFLPPLYIFCLLAGGLLGYTWTNWNGNPHTKLLLRLLDEKLDG